MKNIISISGFGWSGSTAARDLLREYSEITHIQTKKTFLKNIA
jgi:glutamate dehydrogenase/leucine dehydrogenase